MEFRSSFDVQSASPVQPAVNIEYTSTSDVKNYQDNHLEFSISTNNSPRNPSVFTRPSTSAQPTLSPYPAISETQHPAILPSSHHLSSSLTASTPGTYRSRVAALSKDVAELTRKQAQLIALLSAKDKENDDLRSHNLKIKECAEQREKILRSEVSSLEHKLSIQESEYRSLKSRYDSSQEAKATEVSTLHSELEILRKKVTSIETSERTERELRQKLEADRSGLEMALRAAERRSEGEAAELRKRVAELERMYAEEVECRRSLEDEVGVLRGENRYLKVSLEDRGKEVESLSLELRRATGHLEQMETELRASGEQHVRLKRAMSRLTETYGELEDHARRLEADAKVYESQTVELDRLRSEMVELQRILLSKEEELLHSDGHVQAMRKMLEKFVDRQ